MPADQERVMKLSESQISWTLAQFPGQVLAEDHPAAAQFCELFGHHTFFLDARGLYVLELIEVPGTDARDGEMISIADWSDANIMRLTTQQPEPTSLVIHLKEIQHWGGDCFDSWILMHSTSELEVDVAR
jgi:hypothetical protein